MVGGRHYRGGADRARRLSAMTRERERALLFLGRLVAGNRASDSTGASQKTKQSAERERLRTRRAPLQIQHADKQKNNRDESPHENGPHKGDALVIPHRASHRRRRERRLSVGSGERLRSGEQRPTRWRCLRGVSARKNQRRKGCGSVLTGVTVGRDCCAGVLMHFDGDQVPFSPLPILATVTVWP